MIMAMTHLRSGHKAVLALELHCCCADQQPEKLSLSFRHQTRMQSVLHQQED